MMKAFKVSSKSKMSLEKRDNILPTGIVSNFDIGIRITPFSKKLNKTMAAFRQPKLGINALNTLAIPETTIMYRTIIKCTVNSPVFYGFSLR